MLMRALSVHIAHEIAGAARIRHSLRPLIGEGEHRRKTRAQCAARSRTHIQLSSSATGSAEWPPDDRLRRTIQYSRDADDRTEKPRRTGSPACAGMTVACGAPPSPSLRAKRSNPSSRIKERRMDCFVARAPRNDVDK